MNFHKLLKPLAFAAFAGLASPAFAVPARPGTVMVTQPDGSSVEIRINGDECRNWLSTPDDFTLMRDRAGFLTFARSENGRLEASELRYTGDTSIKLAASRGFIRGLRPKETKFAAKRRATSTQIEGTFPATGNRKLLMLLVNFSDTQNSIIPEAFDAYMNLENFASTGSFRDFYLENSYGKLDIQTTVTKWITVPYPKSYYNTDNAEQLIMDALRLIDDEIDLNDFDNDGDGILDGLAVIHQGCGQEASGNSDEIWSHSGTLYGESMDGVRLQRYTIEPEILYDANQQGMMATIGVMCHEFGHNLGAPDFYDTDYIVNGEFPGTGVWDLMGGGAWNGPNFSGTQPAGINMWQKIQLGWVEPEVLTESKSVKGVKAAHNNAVAYRIDTTEPGEYFILENRQQEGRFDSALPGHGLIVYHANDNLVAENVISNTVNSKFPQAMYTVCAGAKEDPNEGPGSYGWVNSDHAPFPGSQDIRIFHDTSTPSTKSMSGRYTYKGLTQITENSDGTIDFEFLSYDMPESPVNLSARVRGGIVQLEWDQPEEKPLNYNIFRNGEKIATQTTTGYTDPNPGSDTNVTYEVDAVYKSGLISPASRVQIFLPVNFITDVKSSVNGRVVTLNWDLSTRLSRMPKLSDNFKTNDYGAKSIEVAHRFRAEDLAIYKGYDIRYINFLSILPQSSTNVTIRVYEMNPKTGEKTVVSERKVSEFANMQWTNSILTKTYKITGDKDIMIAVRYESKTGSSLQVLCDLEPTSPGLGNLSRLNDGEWAVDTRAEGNFFIAATLRAPSTYDAAASPVTRPVADFLADTSYPIGFVIYQDGEEIGRSTGRSFTHLSQPGDHLYTITSLYKGSNESASIENSVYVDIMTSVEEIASDMKVESGNGTISVSGIEGDIIITDLAGRIVTNRSSDGSSMTVSLPAGLYLVRTSTVNAKVFVR